MEKRWLSQLVRALAIIPVVTMLHGVTISAVVFVGLTLDSLDRRTDPSFWTQAATRIVEVLTFPMRQVVEQRGYASPHSNLVWWSNSLLWGVGVFLLLESRRMLRCKAP
jgi:hypothetical protein